MIAEDIRGIEKEQPSWRIGFYNVGEFIHSRVFPLIKWVVVYLVVSCAIALVFALLYEMVLIESKDSLAEVDSGSLASSFRDSFLLFENLPILSDGGQPKFLSEIQSNGGSDELLWLVSLLMLAECVTGVVVNGILVAVIVSVAMKPLNPIWLAPSFVLDKNEKNPVLCFKYWIRYPEDMWLHRFVLTVRILSDEADRSIEEDDETLFESELKRVIRRGMCEYKLPLLSNADDPSNKLLEVISKIAVARFGDSGRRYQIWDSSTCSIVPKTTEDLEGFGSYQINYRVAGATESAQEVSSEKKYTIDNLLFGFSFMPAEVPENKAELTHADVFGIPWKDGESKENGKKKYRFFYRNIWKVVPSEARDAAEGHPGVDMVTIDYGDAQSDSLLEYLQELARVQKMRME